MIVKHLWCLVVKALKDPHKFCSMNQRGFSNLSFMVHKIVWASRVSNLELKFLHIEDGRLLQPSEKKYYISI